MVSTRFEPMSIRERGQLVRAVAAAHAFKPETGEFKGRITCTRCGRDTLRFTIMVTGVSWGQCSNGCGVKWSN